MILGDLCDKRPETGVTLRARAAIDVDNSNQTPWESLPDALVPSTRRDFVVLRPSPGPPKMPRGGPGVVRRSDCPQQCQQHGRFPANTRIPLACPKFVPMAKTRGYTAAGHRPSRCVTALCHGVTRGEGPESSPVTSHSASDNAQARARRVPVSSTRTAISATTVTSLLLALLNAHLCGVASSSPRTSSPQPLCATVLCLTTR